MKRIRWVIEEREVPGAGLMTTGKTYLIEKTMADQLIKQGHAEPVKKKSKSKQED